MIGAFRLLCDGCGKSHLSPCLRANLTLRIISFESATDGFETCVVAVRINFFGLSFTFILSRRLLFVKQGFRLACFVVVVTLTFSALFVVHAQSQSSTVDPFVAVMVCTQLLNPTVSGSLLK